MSAANALLKAIHARLAGDPGLVAMIGTDGIHDRLLARPKLQAIVIGEMETRDLFTVAEQDEQHFLTLEIWSEGDGRRQVLEITARVTACSTMQL